MSHLVEQFRDIVAKTQNVVLPKLVAVDPKIVTLHYEHGHYDEIETTLAQFEASRQHYNKKYPLIALFEDVLQRVVNGITEVRFTLVICYNSDREYKSKDRYREVINPILMPIYEELLNQILESGLYYGYQVKHDMIVRPFAGGAGERGTKGALFSDILDAIEMRDIVLKLYPVNPCE